MSLFLRYLCVLTITWNTINFYNIWQNFSNPDVSLHLINENVKQTKEMLLKNGYSVKDQEQSQEMLYKEISAIDGDDIKHASAVSMISCAVLILAAIMMWDLKKIGLKIYPLGLALGSLSPMFTIGGALGMALTIFCLIFAGLSYLLYSLQKKYLVK